MRISLIAAVANNGVIGRRGQLPWGLKADLRRFRQLTMGHTVIMGRKTWESIGRPLPGRQMVVVTRQTDYQAEGIDVVDNIKDAIEIARSAGDVEAFVIGGAEIYALALPCADRLYLTRVHAEVEGDAMFPDFDAECWRLVEAESHSADEANEFPVTFELYVRA